MDHIVPIDDDGLMLHADPDRNLYDVEDLTDGCTLVCFTFADIQKLYIEACIARRRNR